MIAVQYSVWFHAIYVLSCVVTTVSVNCFQLLVLCLYSHFVPTVCQFALTAMVECPNLYFVFYSCDDLKFSMHCEKKRTFKLH